MSEMTQGRGDRSPAARFAREFILGEGDAALAYEAVAEDIVVTDAKGAPWASFFTTSYTVDGDGQANRPVAFVFNGGPGSSAQWLHMGALGPRRLVTPDLPHAFAPLPCTVEENPRTLLRLADLVFIDPVGTGYSRALGEYEDKQFWGVREDARSIASCIEAWLTRHGRWNSPKHVISESYGTIRACVLAERLAERHIALDGLALIAPVLDYRNSRPRPGDGAILSYLSFLPTYAAAAHYHGHVPQALADSSIEAVIEAARAFALGDYAHALAANPHRLDPQTLSRIVDRLAELTGLDRTYIEQSGLRVLPDRFAKELLRTEGKITGRLDARFLGEEVLRAGDRTDSDPAFDAVAAAFTAAIHGEMRLLGVEMDRPYEAMVPLYEQWDWALEDKPPSGGGYLDVVPALARTMCRYPAMRVLAALGYYDLATPFFGVENALSRAGLPHERLIWRHYRVGHMIFLDAACRDGLLNDLGDLVTGAMPVGR